MVVKKRVSCQKLKVCTQSEIIADVMHDYRRISRDIIHNYTRVYYSFRLYIDHFLRASVTF